MIDEEEGQTMISDDERREVAARLREWVATPWYDRPWSHDTMQSLGEMVGAVPGEDIVERIADLIDRPTCYVVEHKTHCGSYGCEEAGQLWVLSCGDECINDSDFPPRYCPECGAMVTEEDGRNV